MSLPSFAGLSPETMLVDLATHLAAGCALGLLYFGGLWWNARLLAQGGHLLGTIALAFARLALIGGLFTFASREGAAPLLALALGVLAGRTVVMQRFGKIAP